MGDNYDGIKVPIAMIASPDKSFSGDLSGLVNEDKGLITDHLNVFPSRSLKSIKNSENW